MLYANRYIFLMGWLVKWGGQILLNRVCKCRGELEALRAIDLDSRHGGSHAHGIGELTLEIGVDVLAHTRVDAIGSNEASGLARRAIVEFIGDIPLGFRENLGEFLVVLDGIEFSLTAARRASMSSQR